MNSEIGTCYQKKTSVSSVKKNERVREFKMLVPVFRGSCVWAIWSTFLKNRKIINQKIFSKSDRVSLLPQYVVGNCEINRKCLRKNRFVREGKFFQILNLIEKSNFHHKQTKKENLSCATSVLVFRYHHSVISYPSLKYEMNPPSRISIF